MNAVGFPSVKVPAQNGGCAAPVLHVFLISPYNNPNPYFLNSSIVTKFFCLT